MAVFAGKLKRSDTLQKTRFALIGCGFIGKLHAKVISSLSNSVLSVVCDQNEEVCCELAKQFNCRSCNDYQEVLDDEEIDAVAICLPSGLHSEITIAAAKAGKHVICEKPIDTVVSRAEEMVSACHENGVKFSVIMQHRFDEPVMHLKKAIDEGIMGQLLWGASRTIWYRDDEYFENPWRGTWKYDGGGALINQSIHYIDLLLYVLGDVRSVSGKCRKLLHKQIETEDIGVANLEFKNGTVGTIEGTTAAYPGLYTELSIFGEKGTVIIRNDQLLFYQFQSGKNSEFENILNPQKANELRQDAAVGDSSHIRQYQDFIDAIQEDRQPIVSGEDALKSLKVIKAIYQSSEEKREIFLSDFKDRK